MTGQYEHNLDSKGRLIIPAALRKELGDSCVVTIYKNLCLFVYSEREWKKFSKKISEQKLVDTGDMRVVYGNTTSCDFDAQGRVLIQQKQRDYVGIKKNVTIIGFANHAEIWDRDAYAAYEAERLAPDRIAAIWDALPI